MPTFPSPRRSLVFARPDSVDFGSDEELYSISDCDRLVHGEKKGVLSKWTNFFHGWQDRYIVLSNGTLSYYKSEFDTAFGCKGSMSLAKADVQAHEFDELRVDICVNDCVYYLRCASRENRQEWIDAFQQAKSFQPDQGYFSEVSSLTSLRRVGSHLSLTSQASSCSSSTTAKVNLSRIKDKILELETLRDIACRQAETLQEYFEECTALSKSVLERQDESSTIQALLQCLVERGADFHGENLTFRATMSGIVATLHHCVDLVTRRDERLQRMLDSEVARRKKAEEVAAQASAEACKSLLTSGPDMEEGPFCQLDEEVFLDAIEGEVDRLEEEDEKKRVQVASKAEIQQQGTDCEYLMDLEAHVSENLQICYEDVGKAWGIIHEDGDLKVFRREYEEGGVVIDPTKAYHSVKGITAYELCHIFFDDKNRLDWESTLESFDVIGRYRPDTVVLHQIHKRIWPSTQRDTVFVSHFRELPQRCTKTERGQGYLVCNYSIDHPAVPNNGRYVRARCTIALLAHTVVAPVEGREVTRDDVTCEIIYSANINPGGWVPPSAIRAVAKREYPKFLRRFTQFALTSVSGQGVAFGPSSTAV